MIRSVFTILFLTICLYAQAQINPKTRVNLYFIADTVNVSKDKRQLEIGEEGVTYFHLYCKCIYPYKRDLIFVADYNAKKIKSAQLPEGNYIKWNELIALAKQEHRFFSSMYILNMVEVLPNKEYLTTPTHLVIVNEEKQIDFWIAPKEKNK